MIVMICLSDISCFIQLSHCFNWCPPSPDLVSYKVTARLTAANWWFSQQQGPVTTYHGVTIIISCVMCKSSCSVTVPVTTQCLLTLTIYYIFSRFLNFQNIRDLKGFVELGFIVGLEKKWQNRNHQICIPASDPEILSHSRSPEPGRVTEPHTPRPGEYRHQRLICACFTPTLEREGTEESINSYCWANKGRQETRQTEAQKALRGRGGNIRDNIA